MEETKRKTNYDPEPEVVFKAYSDKRVFAVQTETGRTLLEISGYDLKAGFDTSLLKSVEDVENMLEGVKDLFRRLVMEELLNPAQKQEETATPGP